MFPARRFGIFLFLLALCPALFAQQAAGQKSLGLALSGSKFLGGTGDNSMLSPVAQLVAGYAFDETYGVELTAGFGWDRDFNHDKSFPFKYLQRRPGTPYRLFMYPVMAHVRMNLIKEQLSYPWISLGTGVLIWDLRDVSGKDKFFLGSRFGKRMYERAYYTMLLGLGSGYTWNLQKNLDLDVSLHYQFMLDQPADMTGYGDVNSGHAEIRFAFKYHFEGWKDTDADGVQDRYDLAPELAEDYDGFEDEDGVPDPDNDQDGVPDIRDLEPNQAEDKDGFQDFDGAPDPDNDKDFVPDDRDLAPNDPEDLDGFEDEDGKPDLDNDQDGIPDSRDNCPDEAETFNGFEDQDGCPDEAPDDVEGSMVVLEESVPLVLQGVTFKTGSTWLSLASRAVLDQVVASLKQNPDAEVMIRGYTDNVGSREVNMRMSEGRAEAVKKYLVSSGISPARLTAKGLGPDSPVASNATAEGRAKNRRIEFLRIK